MMNSASITQQTATCGLSANIAGREVKKRRLAALACVAVSAVLFSMLFSSDYPRFFRILLWLPLFASTLGFYQVKRSHCVVLGFKGAKSMGLGEEPVKDAAQKALFRNVSLNMLVKSALVAAALTAAACFL